MYKCQLLFLLRYIVANCFCIGFAVSPLRSGEFEESATAQNKVSSEFVFEKHSFAIQQVSRERDTLESTSDTSFLKIQQRSPESDTLKLTNDSSLLRTTQSDGLVAGGQALAPKEDDPPNYELHPVWRDIAGMSDGQQMGEIGREIEQLWQQRRYISFDSARSIDRAWSALKEERNQTWLDSFYRFDSIAGAQYKVLVDGLQRCDEFKSKIDMLRQGIVVIVKEIAGLEKRRNQILQQRDKMRKDYRSRLANVTVTKLMFGVAPLEEDDQAGLNERIVKRLSRAALQDVVGRQIRSISLVRNDSLILRSISSSSEGTTSDNEQFRFNSDINCHIFLRVEVNPFAPMRSESLTPLTSMPILVGMDSVRIFEMVGRDEMCEYEFYPDLSGYCRSSRVTKIDTMLVRGKTLNWVRSQQRIVEETNRRIESKIRGSKTSFAEQESLWEKDLNRQDEQISAAIERRNSMNSSILGLEEKIIDQDMASENAGKAFRQSMESYRSHYESRSGYFDKSGQDTYDANNSAGPTSAKQICVKLAQTTKIALWNDLRKKYIKSSVLMQDNSSGNIILRSDREVSYRPNIVEFCILYIARDQDESKVTSRLSVDVGYRIRYSANRIGGITLLPDTIRDHVRRLEWIRTETTNGSADEIGERLPLGLRLPTIGELKGLDSLSRDYSVENDMNLFDKMQWPYDRPFLSSDQSLTKEGETQFLSFDIRKRAEQKMGGGRTVSVIFVRQIRDDGQ